MRVVFAILLAANLAFLAWASFIDRPAEVRAAGTRTSRLPRLVLASEAGANDGAHRQRPIDAAGGEGTAPAAVNEPRCVTVGPFSELAHSERATALLRERGFDPQQRTAEGERWEGFWVYIDGFPTEAEKLRVLQRLEERGIRDARAMPDSAGSRTISLGLFTERARAERRAQAVERLGFRPQIAERWKPGIVYWVDLRLGTESQRVPTDELLSLEQLGSVEVKPCPEMIGAIPADTEPPSTPVAASEPAAARPQ